MTQYLPKIKLGDKFGKLTVLHVDGKRNRNISYLCQCDCGNTKSVASHHLKSGNIKSCGCYAVECARKQHALNFVTHGMSQKSEFNIWQHMKDRCNNPNNDSYKYYGERGITVCDRWLHSFEAFYADMGPRPSRGHSIDRIDVNGNYEPGNCRWATNEEQARNKRRTIMGITPDGVMCVEEIVAKYGLTRHVVCKRIRQGLTGQDLIAKPTDTRLGKQQWSSVTGNPKDTDFINGRIGDYTGRRFGKVTVLRMVGREDNFPIWLCVCDCGAQLTCSHRVVRNRQNIACKACLYARAAQIAEGM